MTAPPDSAPLSPLLDGRFSGRVAFAALVTNAFATAAEQGWSSITVCDADFADWPLGDRAVAESLNRWAKSGRRFTMLARDYGEVQRRHARFVTWRRTWAHLVDCRSSAATPVDDMPSAMLGPGWVFERLSVAQGDGIAGPEPIRRVALRERVNERLLKSTPAFPASTLGL